MLSSDETSEEQLEEVMKEVEAEEAEEDAKEQQAVAWLQSREEKKMAIQVGFICCPCLQIILCCLSNQCLHYRRH